MAIGYIADTPSKWKFKVIEETKEQYGILKSLMQNETVYEIICATDAGREGECIFRYVYKLAGCNKPVKDYGYPLSRNPTYVRDLII